VASPIYEALSQKKNVSIGYRMLISMAAASGNRHEKTMAYAEGIKQVPYSYWIRCEYLEKLQPKWGGSWEEMRQFADRAAEEASHNRYLTELKYFAPYHEGRSVSSHGDKEKAIKLYTEALQYFRGPWALHARAYAYQELGEYGKALDDLNEALQIDPKYLTAVEHRADVYIAMKDNARALKDLERAVVLDPKSKETLGTHASLLWNMGKFSEAHRVFERLVELYPKYAWGWSSKGRLNLEELKNYNQAAEDLLKAIALKPKAEIWYDYASALYFLEDDRTVAAYQNYLDLCKQGKPCKGKDRNWAKQFMQCVNKSPECEWPERIYGHWVKSENG
jgi:tetratricopeptide (TPR) repeat protein